MKQNIHLSNENNKDNVKYGLHTKSLVLILLVILILTLPLMLIIDQTTDSTSSNDFYINNKSFTSTSLNKDYQGIHNSRANGPGPEVIVKYTPKDPIDSEEVNVTIFSKNGETITWAYMSITLITSGELRSGNYAFKAINTTEWYSIIPGDQNRGETRVIFYVTVQFDNIEIKTDEFEYIVGYTGSWTSTYFYENLDIDYTPKIPNSTEPVNITINSKDNIVPIHQALLQLQVKIPGYTPYIGGENFTRINLTHMYVLIPGYFGETNITFWVEAYDQALKKVVSEKYNYVVKIPPAPKQSQWLIVTVYDEAKDELVSDAKITLSNLTWKYVYDKNDHDGYVWSPVTLNPGSYTIKVETDEDQELIKVNMPTEDENHTRVIVRFNVAEAEGILVEIEEFPQWFVNVTFFGIILFGLVFYFFYEELLSISKAQEKEMKRKMASDREKFASNLKRSRQQRKKSSKVKRTKSSGIHPYGRMQQQSRPTSTEWMKETFSLTAFGKVWQPWLILNKILNEEDYKVNATKIFGFLILGLLGATWAPFYPWWMVLIIGIVIGALAYKFPYVALIFLIIFVIGSTSYQHPGFGWLFMMFSLLIAVGALFDWRFGYLVFLTIFISRLGVAFVVPIVTGMLISLFMGLAVAIASGIFITFLVTAGDITILSFFIGPTHDYGFITFSKPHISNFMPTDFTKAFISLYDLNIESITTILQSNYTSMIPFIQIIIWLVAIFVTGYLFHKYTKDDLKKSLVLSLLPSLILLSSGVGSILIYDHSVNVITWALLIGIFGILLTAILFAFMSMELYKEFYLGKTKEMPIGTRIGEMLTLRKTNFRSIGGLKEIKCELKDTMIGPLLRPQKAKEYGVEPPRGVMLFGPPGCGKTLLMRALATELNVEMVGVRCSDVMSKWYGESEAMIEKLFQAVKERKPCILFLDEIDAIAKRRDFYSADDVTPRLLSIMLSELDGMDEASGVIVVGATNKPELVDPALMRPGRFDKIIFIPAPDYKSRIEIFKIHLKSKPYSENIDLNNLAQATEGYTGADIENVVKEAAQIAMKRSISIGRPTKITNTDFLKIIPRIKPSMTTDMKQEYQKLQLDFERKKYGREIKLPPTEDAMGTGVGDLGRSRARARTGTGRSRAVGAGISTSDEEMARKGRRRRKKTTKWKDVVGLDHSKQFFSNIIKNNKSGGK